MGDGASDDGSAAASDRRRPLPWGRWALVAALLVAEYLALSFFYDVRHLTSAVGWLGATGSLAPLAVVAASAVLILARVPGRQAVADLTAALHPLPRIVPWAALHAASVGLFFVLCHRLLRPDAGPPSLALLIGWTVAGLALVGTAIGLC